MTLIETEPTTTSGPGPQDRIGRLLADHRPGFALPGPLYTSQEAYDLDLAAIWGSTWLQVATEAEVREPGDFVVVDIGPSSVIVIRDDDEEVRGLHNVCRHRGARVLTEPSGSVGNIVCGYHQWTYSTDGSLMFAGDQAPGFDRSCFGLRSVHLRVVAGLIFVCLAPEPPADIDEMAEAVAPYLTPHGLDRTKVAAQTELVEHANWKLVMENNRECYHCEAGHPELIRTFFPTYGYAEDKIPARLKPAHERYLAAEAELAGACAAIGMPRDAILRLEEPVTGFRIQREALDGAGESYTLDGSRACRRLLADLDNPRLGRASFHLQPNGWFHAMADHAVVFSALPVAPDRTLIRTTWLVHEDAVEGEDYDVEQLTYVWRQTNAQDAALCERAQIGVSDPAYLPGPYAPTEYDVEAFVGWYLRRLAEHRTQKEATDV